MCNIVGDDRRTLQYVIKLLEFCYNAHMGNSHIIKCLEFYSIMYNGSKEYEIFFKIIKKLLHIRQEILPEEHPDIG